MAAPKIIVLGSLNGQLEPALKKLATLHAKNQFSLAILTGDVFTTDTDDETISALLGGLSRFPFPPTSLSACILYRLESPPRIVTLGGVLDTNLVAGQSQEQHLPFHTAGDAKALRGANSTDILLTSMWPAKVWTGSKVVLEPSHQAAPLKPRYHISASPEAFFYEREPFVQQSDKDPNTIVATRFISMAPYGNDKKQKAMYAFTLNTADTAVPPGATASPFAKPAAKRGRQDEGYSRFGHHDDGHHGRHKRRRASPPPGPDRCYFCLSNPNISAHMCCSIGDEAYVTTAKGPLPTSSTFADQGLDFPGHFIIIPLPHSPTISSMGSVADPTSEAVKAYKEMTRFKESIQAMIASKSSHKLGVVTYEISRDRNVHLIWQLVAVPAEIIQKGLAEAAFRVEAENLKYPGFTTKDLPLEDLASSGDFFRVWLWADNGEDKIKGKSLVMPLASDARFDLQFGRRVLAKLMGLEKRVSWQNCEQSVEEETKDVEAFREAFKEWDFTL
ncbi:hypothetical protein TrVGV298_008950 [Trichoderma virens]|nr:hypothetical protein TrVGV298_008950 [Trichoderma virens]